MARERMVTRTITSTMANVMTVDVLTAEVSILPYTISGEYENNDELLKAIKKLYETDTQKLVSVQDAVTITELYGMPEVEFMQYAKLLPPR